MDCTEFLDRYSEYDDSLVAADEAEQFRAHMSACEGCTRYDRVLRKGRMLARQLPAPEPSSDFVPQLHMRLWSERTRPERPTSRIPMAVAALPAVTIVATLAALLVLTPGRDSAAASLFRPDAVQQAPMAQHGTAAQRATLAQQSSVTHWDRLSRQAPASPGVGLARFAHGSPSGWTASRVDPEAFGSYSPLTIGPPAYGGAKPRLGVSLTTYPSPD